MPYKVQLLLFSFFCPSAPWPPLPFIYPILHCCSSFLPYCSASAQMALFCSTAPHSTALLYCSLPNKWCYIAKPLLHIRQEQRHIKFICFHNSRASGPLKIFHLRSVLNVIIAPCLCSCTAPQYLPTKIILVQVCKGYTTVHVWRLLRAVFWKFFRTFRIQVK